MMYVYVVTWDNGESYEDHRETVECICASAEIALALCAARGYTKIEQGHNLRNGMSYWFCRYHLSIEEVNEKYPQGDMDDDTYGEYWRECDRSFAFYEIREMPVLDEVNHNDPA